MATIQVATGSMQTASTGPASGRQGKHRGPLVTSMTTAQQGRLYAVSRFSLSHDKGMATTPR